MSGANAVTSHVVQTDRLKIHYLASGAEQGTPVLFIHGNCSSSRFYRETLAALPPGLRGFALDLRGYGETEGKPIDATRGLRDFSDDCHSFLRALGLSERKVQVLGWSLGGGVALQLAIDHPSQVKALVLESPISPYGFGGTKDVQGTPCWPDCAGSGGGTANPEFTKRLAAGDRSAETPFSPRNVMNALYFKPPFRTAEEEDFVTAMLQMKGGEDFSPGDLTVSSNWPGIAPGKRGVNNAFSPRYQNLSAFCEIQKGPEVLWIRGAEDQIVSDTSLLDFGFLGQLGAVPGWPGKEIYPPQPMVSQLRAVLDRYRENGGRYHEEVLADCGHSPHLEKASEFQAKVFPFLLNPA